MSDIAIHIQVNDGDRQRVTVPSEMKASDFLKELVEGLNLPSTNGNGRRLNWKLIHRTTGRTLELDRTLHENGVNGGQELTLRAEEPEPSPVPLICQHCGLENEPGNKFCRKCGKPIMGRGKMASDLRFHFHTLEGKEEEVEAPGSFSGLELIADVLGDAAQGHEWTLYDKDTGADLDLTKSLAENGVRSGHSLYLRRAPVAGELPKPINKGEKVVPPKPASKPLPWRMILGIALVLVALAGAAKLVVSVSSGRVAVRPAKADLKISEHQQFTATVGGAPGPVRWSINPEMGTIDSAGLYTAPHSVAALTMVTVTATGVKNPNKSSSSRITLEAGREVVEINPENATLAAGESAEFTASVSGIGNARVRWSINRDVGTIAQDGRYTAPAPVPDDMTIEVIATSEADAERSAKALVTLKPVTVTLNPKSATALASAYVRFEAVLGGTSNHGVRWTLTGPGSVSKNGVYFAPKDISEKKNAQVTATSSADPTKSATAVVRLQPVVAIRVSPANGTVGAGQRERFTSAISGSTNTAVSWKLTGPGSISPDGVYQAPSSIGAEETARITVTSDADRSKSASATVTLRPVSVTISPANVELLASQTKKFNVQVLSSNNLGVHWTLSGRGSVTQDGVYTAPPLIPTDQYARVTATSTADPSRSATANVILKRYNGPMTGTLIWQGSLPKNGTLTIDESGPSVGSLQGDMFPGLPVLIKLDNNKDYGITQTPNPGNDFKRVTITSKRGKGSGVKITWVVVRDAAVKP